VKRITQDIVHFFKEQGYVIVVTVDKHGNPHSACKGIVQINKNGKIYLLDLYRKNTYKNLKHNAHISITAVEEHKFKGYCLKGKARILETKKLKAGLLKAWEERIASRLTQRLLRNIREEKSHPGHPEALLPKPEYIICMEIEEIIDLTPQHLKGI
jgi:uncharacterized pyridoxamine 5'-phosphate oxidase family protein